MPEEARFSSTRIKLIDACREAIRDCFPDSKIEDYVVSSTIKAIKARQNVVEEL
jgi:cobalamin biosynthesis Co2+ chelatase CbiK